MRDLSACSRVGAAALLILAAGAARGDDWPQFRRDGARSGVSLDPLKFPLTDVWTWDTFDIENHSPLAQASIWKDAAYFVAGDGPSRYAMCADAKTGAIRWRQRLSSLRIPGPQSDMVGPAISTGGKVFVYDWQPGKPPPVYSVLRRRVPRSQIASSLAEIGGLIVRVYDARDGRPLDFLPLGALGVAGPPAQVSLLHVPSPRGFHPTQPLVFPAPPWRDMFGSQNLGHPLLTGDELTATGFLDLFLRWTPGGHPTFSIVNHPMPGQEPDAAPPTQFRHYPPVAVSGGTLVGDDMTHRFLATLSGTMASRWQRDLNTSVGPAASDNDSVLMGMGGVGANRALACLEGSSGELRWLYAPQGLPPDPQKMESVFVSRLARKLVLLGEEPPRPPRTTEELRALTERLMRQGMVTELQPETVATRQLNSGLMPGPVSSAGPVVSEGRVYADVDGVVTALDQKLGTVLWRQPLAEGVKLIRSLVGAREHLLVSFSHTPEPPRLGSTARAQHRVAALRRDNGKILWQTRIPNSGMLSLAGGLTYFANGALTAMAPAERTYRLAVDSDDAKVYAEGPFSATVTPPPDATDIPGGAASSPGEATLPPEVRGDASVLKLTLDRPADELVNRARERRAKIRLLPLVIQLDWLSANRSTLVGGALGRWTPERIEAFAALCGRIVEAARPTHLDIAPEFNVYLRHHPEEGPAVLNLIRRATAAARAAAAGCKVLASLDPEVLLGLYGQGRVLPHGELPKLRRGESPMPAELNQIVRELDAIGLMSHPQSAFKYPKEMPGDHLFRVRRWIGETKPLVVLQGSVLVDTRAADEQARQASFAHRLHQACYWLNAEIVVPPRITLDAEATRAAALRRLEPAKLEEERWRRALLFERVSVLTVAPPEVSPKPATDAAGGCHHQIGQVALRQSRHRARYSPARRGSGRTG